jgi:hypothetical protein
MPEYPPGVIIHDIAAVQLANSVVAEARPLANGKSTGFVVYQTQRKIQTLAVSGVTVIGHSHGRLLPLVQFARFPLKNNLTEINHKVSVLAK